MIKKIIKYVSIKYYDSSYERRRRYLIKKGAQIGEGTRIRNISSFSSEPYLIKVGKDVLFSGEVFMTTHDGGIKVLNSLGFFDESNDKMGRIIIGDNCFIGQKSVILPGVTIGNNVIIGAGSVVSKDIPSNTVAAGIPAKVICSIEEYYKRNLEKGCFYPTGNMSSQEKKEYLIKSVK